MDAEIDSARANRRARVRIRVDGIVQGVGFRPFVHSLAGRIMLSGFVRNDSRGVVIEVEGAQDRLDEFIDKLQSEAPPLAAIERIESLTIPLAGDGQVRDKRKRRRGRSRRFDRTGHRHLRRLCAGDF